MRSRSVSRLALLLPIALAAPAGAVTILASDSGWHSSSGDHTATNQNYSAGWVDEELRNFFVFDLSSYAGDPIVGATLRVYSPDVCEPDCSYTGGYASPDATETYELREVLSPSVLVTAPTVSNTTVFDDLGDGPVFGSRQVSLADNGTFIEISLNAQGLAAVQAAAGVGDLVLGGLVTSLTSSFGTEEAIFGHTDPQGIGPYARELVLVTAVPEPGTATLLALGLIGTAVSRRIRR